MTALAPQTPVPNAAAKSQLARLMATENITVEYDGKAQTASFNMETRVLILPMWKDLSADALDMLIGHEVSHALHTPAGRKPLEEACKRIDPKNYMVAKDYLNVVEDARIERMIKAQFPGLKRSFATGYRELKERDLFGLKKIDSIAALPLIDRINLQYKIGWLIEVPFSAQELPLVQRVATTITWDDVVTLSKEIYDLARKQNSDNKSNASSDSSDGEDGEEGAGGSSEPQDGEENESDTEEGAVPAQSEEDGEEEEGEGNGSDTSSESDADEESDSTGEGEEGENDDAEDGNVGGESKSDTDMDADSSDSSDSDAEEGESKGKPDQAESTDNPAPMSQTMQNMEKGLGNLVDTTAPAIHYADLPEIDAGYVVTLKDTRHSLKTWAAKVNGETMGNHVYAAWKANNAPAVQVLATEFDRRKAADAHKRTAVAETGSIDPNRLHAYRIAEDIFLQNAYVKEGKNHGIVLLLDMSGSMAPIFHDTMVQLVTLAHFCRRVNVPFTFYGFSDRDDSLIARLPSFKKNSYGAETTRTRLFTLLQDGMKQNEFMETCGLLLLASFVGGGGVGDDHPTRKALKTHNWNTPYYTVEWMRLDNTPTNAALLGMPQIVSEFKRVKRVQIANLIVLTDGEPSDDLVGLNKTAWYEKNTNADRSWRNQPRIVWRDKKTRKDYTATYKYVNYDQSSTEYTLDREKQSALLMQIVRDRTDAKTICIHLINKRGGRELAKHIANASMRDMVDAKLTPAVRAKMAQAAVEKVEKSWDDNDWAGIPNGRGFNEYIVVRCDTKYEEFDLDEVDMNSKSGLRDLRKTFTKSMAATRANRPLLTRVADLISKK
jgi:hypothetical protein